MKTSLCIDQIYSKTLTMTILLPLQAVTLAVYNMVRYTTVSSSKRLLVVRFGGFLRSGLI